MRKFLPATNTSPTTPSSLTESNRASPPRALWHSTPSPPADHPAREAPSFANSLGSLRPDPQPSAPPSAAITATKPTSALAPSINWGLIALDVAKITITATTFKSAPTSNSSPQPIPRSPTPAAKNGKAPGPSPFGNNVWLGGGGHSSPPRCLHRLQLRSSSGWRRHRHPQSSRKHRRCRQPRPRHPITLTSARTHLPEPGYDFGELSRTVGPVPSRHRSYPTSMTYLPAQVRNSTALENRTTQELSQTDSCSKFPPSKQVAAGAQPADYIRQLLFNHRSLR